MELTETKGGKSRGRGGRCEARGNDSESSQRCWSLLKRTWVLLNHSKLQRLFIKASPGDGEQLPLPSSSHPPSSFFPSLSVSLTFSISPPLPPVSHLKKTAGREASAREDERGRDKRTQRSSRRGSATARLPRRTPFLRNCLLLLLLRLNQQSCLALRIFCSNARVRNG